MEKHISYYNRKLLLFVAMILFVSCTREDNEYALNNIDGFTPNSIIYFKNIDSQSIEADGVSISTVSIQIHPEADAAFRQILLTTSQGKFANGQKTDTITANAYGIAYFTLSSETIGKAMITATVRSYTVATSVNFEPALPDDMIISADRSVIDNTQSVTISSQLIRDSFRGKVSDPVKVYYSVTPLSAQTNALVYPNFAMSTQGISSVTIANPFILSGDFKVKAETISSDNENLTKELIFRIQ